MPVYEKPDAVLYFLERVLGASREVSSNFVFLYLG